MSRRILDLALLAALAVPTGCHDGTAPEPAVARPAVAPQAEPTPEPTAEPAPQIDPRDQYTLAHEIAQARRVREDLEGTLARTRAQWVGRRYRWELALLPALCPAVGPCVALPFDHLRSTTKPIRQGWLPRLALDADQRTALLAQCAPHARCVLDISAALDQFELSTEQPTSMTLSNVEVHAVRGMRSGESWVLGNRRPASANG